jgi:hypothetical protein
LLIFPIDPGTAPQMSVEVLGDLARASRLYFMRHFRKRKVFHWLRKAHPHPGEPEQICALGRISGSLRKEQ